MLAVSTMNFGYFLGVLAGIFLGELMFGGFVAVDTAASEAGFV